MKERERTRNLSIREIHIGDWVQVWSPGKKSYSYPVKVTGIFADGSVHAKPFDDSDEMVMTKIHFVDALPVDEALVESFGFERIDGGNAYVSKDKVLVYDCRENALLMQYNNDVGYHKIFGDCLSEMQEEMFNRGYVPELNTRKECVL